MDVLVNKRGGKHNFFSEREKRNYYEYIHQLLHDVTSMTEIAGGLRIMKRIFDIDHVLVEIDVENALALRNKANMDKIMENVIENFIDAELLLNIGSKSAPVS